MTRKATSISIAALVAFLIVPALGQKAETPAPGPRPEPGAKQLMLQAKKGAVDPVELMRQMGADEDDILRLQLMSQVMGADMGQMMLLMMLADKGGIDDDFIGMMLFMKALTGASKQPIALLDGNTLLVIEDGTVYRINTATLKVEGSVGYRQNKTGAGGLGALMPLITHARGKAQSAKCLSNMKQLCMSAHMYAGDNGDMLPTEQWQDQLAPYVKNRAIYRCPAAPGKQIGYVINEAVIGAALQDIKRPGQTVLFFESDPAHDLPFGGLDAVIAEPRHEGRIVVGFVDGHAQLMTPEELQQLLAQDTFQ